MCYGLKTSPTHFQRLMNLILAPFIGKCAQVYIDDIIIYSKSVDVHHEHVSAICKALCNAGLKLKLPKCKFHQSEVLIWGCFFYINIYLFIEVYNTHNAG